MSKKLLFNFNREVIQNYTYVKYVGTIITATNTLEKPIKSAILKGNTLVNVLNYNDSLVSATNECVQINSMMKEIIGTTITIFNNSDKPMRIQTSLNGVYNRQLTINKNAKTVVELNANEKLDRLRGSQSDGWSIDEIGLNELKITAMILEGDYTNIDIPYFTGMQSVKVPVLTTSNEDGTKTNILTVNEDVTLRGIGEVKDELNCSTGEVTVRIKEVVLNGSENWTTRNGGTSYAYFINNFFDYNNVEGITNSFKFIKGGSMSTQTQESICSATTQTALSLFTNKYELSTVQKLKTYLSKNPVTIQYIPEEESIKTVDLSILDQNENKVSSISSFNDTTHITASSETIPPIFEGYLATKEVE